MNCSSFVGENYHKRFFQKNINHKRVLYNCQGYFGFGFLFFEVALCRGSDDLALFVYVAFIVWIWLLKN